MSILGSLAALFIGVAIGFALGSYGENVLNRILRDEGHYPRKR